MNIVVKVHFKFYKWESSTILRVKEAVYPLYFIGNMVDSVVVHRKPRKKSHPDHNFIFVSQFCKCIKTDKHNVYMFKGKHR